MPGVELHLLALRKQMVVLAGSDPIWDAVHFIEPTQKNTAIDIMKVLFTLKACHFDISISFFPSNNWQYNLLPFIIGCKKRYVFKYNHKKCTSLSLLATEYLPVDSSKHDIDQNRAISALVTGIQPDNTIPLVFPDLITEQDKSLADTIIPSTSRYFVIHPGSSKEHGMNAKRWPAKRFGLLADNICSMLNATAVIVGGSDEEALKQQTAEVMSQSFKILRPQPLSVTAALLKSALFCLCNDSGIMHLAACNNIPVAALFGPTDEHRNGPYGDRHCILRKNMEGFPVWTAENVGVRTLPPGIDPNRSLKEFSVEEAWKKLQPFIRQLIH